MIATIFLSRYPGEPFVPPPPPRADLISIHRHALVAGRCLVFEWSWDALAENFEQTFVADVPCDQARDYVPAGFAPVECPPEFGISAWRAA